MISSRLKPSLRAEFNAVVVAWSPWIVAKALLMPQDRSSAVASRSCVVHHYGVVFKEATRPLRLEAQPHEIGVGAVVGAVVGALQTLVGEARAQHHRARELVVEPRPDREGLVLQGDPWKSLTVTPASPVRLRLRRRSCWTSRRADCVRVPFEFASVVSSIELWALRRTVVRGVADQISAASTSGPRRSRRRGSS